MSDESFRDRIERRFAESIYGKPHNITIDPQLTAIAAVYADEHERIYWERRMKELRIEEFATKRFYKRPYRIPGWRPKEVTK